MPMYIQGLNSVLGWNLEASRKSIRRYLPLYLELRLKKLRGIPCFNVEIKDRLR